MPYFTRIPVPLLLCELAGGVLVILALLLVNHVISLPGAEDPHRVAKVVLIIGLIMMLPAAVMIFWRAIRSVTAKK